MDDSRIKVLLIEDNPGDSRLIREMLAEVGPTPFDLEWADQLATGLEHLSANEIGLVLLDLGLPDSQGLETFAQVHALAPDVPIVVLSGFADEAIAIQAVQKGAQDYLVKGSVDGHLLVRAMRYALERKQTEEALRASEAELSAIFENAPVVMILVDRERRVLKVNRTTVEFTGRPVEELIGLRGGEALRCLHSLDASEGCGFGPFCQTCLVRRTVLDTFETGQSHRQVEARLPFARDENQEELDLLVSTAPISVLESQMVLVCVEDITNRKRAEEALQRERDFAEGLIETAQAIVLVLDTEGRIIRFNPYLETISGYRLEEVQGKDWFTTFLPERDRSRVRELFLQAVEDIQTRGNVNPIVTKDGRECEIEWYDKTLKDADGNVFGLLAVGQDITEHRRAEEEVRRLKEFNEGIVQSMAEALLLEDAAGIITFVNPALEALLGYTAHELVGRHWQTIVPKNEVQQVQEKTSHRAGGVGEQYETRLLAADGTEISVIVNARALFEGETFTGVLSAFTDITARKRREAELEAIAQVSAALRTAETRAEMLPVILDQVRDLLNAEGAALAIRDPVSNEAVCELGQGGWEDWTGVRLPPGEGVSGQVLSTGQLYLSNDVRSDRRFARPDLVADLHAMACVPLIAQRQTIGALWVGRRTDIGQEEVRLLTAIANITANAFHRATLHEQTQQRLQRLAALRDIDMAISASVDLRVTLNILLDQVTIQLAVDAADVLLFNTYTKTLEYAGGRGFRTTALQHTRVRLGEGHAGRAALERRLIDVGNLAEAENNSGRFSLLANEGFITYYGVPLVAKGQVKGVLEIFHRAPLIPDPEWLDFLGTMAGQAAIAIDNAELFESLQRANIELTLAYDTTLEGWAHALELRDMETEGHTRRVTEMTLRLAQAMGMSDAELVHVRRGALLHDIGKMGIPDRILLKPSSLTEEEWEIMRQHPVYAYEMLTPIAYLRQALDIPYCHHEKWDGTGYPRGLKGETIPLSARIFAVVDVWDALRSDRPYRDAWSEQKALAHIREQAGEHFDPQVVEMFLELVMEEQADELTGE